MPSLWKLQWSESTVLFCFEQASVVSIKCHRHIALPFIPIFLHVVRLKAPWGQTECLNLVTPAFNTVPAGVPQGLKNTHSPHACIEE